MTATQLTTTPDGLGDEASLVLSHVLAAVQSGRPYGKRLRVLERIEDYAIDLRQSALGRSNVFPLGAARAGWTPETLSTARQNAHTVASAILGAVEAVRKQRMAERAMLQGRSNEG